MQVTDLLEKATAALAALRIKQRDAAVRDTERALETAMADAFALEWSAFHARLRRFVKLFPVTEALSDKDERDMLKVLASTQTRRAEKLAAKLRALLVQAFGAGWKAGATKLKIATAFDVANPRAVRWLKSHAAELVKGIDATTRARVASIVTQAVEEGWAYTKTEAALKELYDGFRTTVPYHAPPGIKRYPTAIGNRASLIAVQEAANAYGAGQYETGHWLAETGVAVEKAWLSAADEHVCDECDSNDGDGWIPLDQAFSSGAEFEPAHVACRCCTELQRAGATT